MSVATESKRLIPGIGEAPASANAYLAFTAVGGVLGWGLTIVVNQFTEAVALAGAAGFVTFAWLAIVGLRASLGFLSVEDGVQMSLPNLIWVGVLVLAFVVTVVGTVIGSGLLMYLPWLAAFAVGYLATGVLVERGGVYLAAGVVSAALTVAAVTVFAGGFPAVFVVLGLLHVVPLAVDAARGGRQMTDGGQPAVAGGGDGGDDDAGVQELGA